MERVILHSDMNGFYASVECLYNPDIRDKPVAVGGNAEQRHGIILAKNELAKKYQVKTGEALWQARQKCPGLVIVPPNYKRYLEFARLSRAIYNTYTDRVEPFGLDEAWLDVGGSIQLFGSGESIANDIRRRIYSELGITASVGVSFNKIFAKLGSDIKKPDATTVITRENFRETVWPLPVEDLLYVGPATKRKLNNYGILTIGDLAGTECDVVRGWLGKIGVMLWRYANGEDSSTVSVFDASREDGIKSIGNSTTTPRDLVTVDDVKITVWLLAESVAARLRKHRMMCRTLQLHLRDNKLFTFERQCALRTATQLASEIAEAGMELFVRHCPGFGQPEGTQLPLRSVGVRACDLLRENEFEQLSMFPEEIRRQKHMAIERTMDDIHRRYGDKSVVRGMMLEDRALSRVNPREHVIFPVGWLRAN